jgi:hypothetical protein
MELVSWAKISKGWEKDNLARKKDAGIWRHPKISFVRRLRFILRILHFDYLFIFINFISILHKTIRQKIISIIL